MPSLGGPVSQRRALPGRGGTPERHALLGTKMALVMTRRGEQGTTGGFVEREVELASGADTLYGTILAPAPGAPAKVPGAVLLAGSGPTDRDGNNPLIPGRMDTLRHFARALADLGIASLRYDKLGSGKTGLASHGANPGEIGFDAFVDQAGAACDLLHGVPEVDARRVLLLGHSEGGLVALVLADRVVPAAPPWALVLASPLGTRYLDTVRRQVAGQVAWAQAKGQLAANEAAATVGEVDGAI